MGNAKYYIAYRTLEGENKVTRPYDSVEEAYDNMEFMQRYGGFESIRLKVLE